VPLSASNSVKGVQLTVKTFDGFTYVTARPAAKDEKDADKARLDKEFKEQRDQLAEKLAR
jgi:hypothetical protein